MRQRLVQLINSIRSKVSGPSGSDDHFRALRKNGGQTSGEIDGHSNGDDIGARTGIYTGDFSGEPENSFEKTHVPFGDSRDGSPMPPPPDIGNDLGMDLTRSGGPMPKSGDVFSEPMSDQYADESSGEFADQPNGRKPRRLGVDLGIVVVALGALAASVFFFFGDGFFSGGQHGDLQQVGHITKSHNDVRRKVDGGLSWGTVASADKVYEGDSVFTGDGSDAVIELDKGGRIAVDPKSLIVIRTKGSDLEVDLQYGSLEGRVQNNQPLLLKQGNETKKIEAKDAQVRIVRTEKSKKTSIQVVSGELKIQDKVVSANETVELVKDQPPVITKARLSLVSPSTGKTMWLPPGKTVDFSWKTDKPDAKYTFELSRSTSFEHPLYNATVQGTSYQLAEESRPSGDFYWRVRPTDDGLPSMPSRLTVYADIPPKLLAPADNYAFSIPANSSTIEIPVSWEDTAGSLSYQVQVASDEEFKTIVLDEKTKTQNFKTKALPQGHYSWRVMGLNPDRSNPPWSKVSSFTVSPATQPMKAPVITQAEWKYVIPQKALKGLIGPIPDDQGIHAENLQPLTWPTVSDATEYQVEQSSEADFKNATKHQVTEASYAPDEVHPGNYFVRVRSKDKDGRVSEPSESAHLEVTVEPPHLAKVKDQAMTFPSSVAAEKDHTKRAFKLSWNAQPFADAYEVEWGADHQFTRSKTFRMKDTAKEISVTRPMPYAARVRALDKAGNPISAYSPAINAEYRKIVSVPKTLPVKREVANVVVPPKPPAPIPVVAAAPKVSGLAMPRISMAPILKEPQPQSSLISLESSPTFVDFKWRAVKGATYYVLEIAQDADFQNKIAAVKVQGDSFVFQKPLPEGHVFWRVRCQLGRSPSDWSDVSDLNVIYQ